MPTDPERKPRILLMGCGAVGGVLAGGLIRAGHDLTIVTHNAAITQALHTEGLHLATPAGRLTVPAETLVGKDHDRVAHTDLVTVDGPFDIALLAMKATGLEQALQSVVALLRPGGYVVTLQNGIVEEGVAGIVGRERVIGALVGWGATMTTPGIYEMTSRGDTVIGELDGAATERVRALKQILEAATPTTISANIYGALWSKLAINCAITTLGATTGQLLGQMLRRANVRRLALAIVSEVIDVADANRVALEPVAGTLDVHRLYLSPEQRTGGFTPGLLLKHTIMGMVGLKFRRLKASMLQSLERGRRPEIDFLNGYVVARGREAGVPTPVNAALVAMVNEIAAGTREIAPENLQALMPLVGR